MISTHLKPKIAQSLSFPVSHRDVAEALADSQQWTESTLTFWDQAIWPASAFRKVLGSGSSYAILVAEYRPEPMASLTTWAIRVNPVERCKRRIARELLIRDGLPRVVQWSAQNREAWWRDRYHRLELVFDPIGEFLDANVVDAAGPAGTAVQRIRGFAWRR